MSTVLIVSGAHEYADPWHPFAETSAKLAAALPTCGKVTVREDVDSALTELDTLTDLLVLNIGNAGPGTPTVGARRALLDYIDGGGRVLAIHSSSTAFPDWVEWEHLLGGRWIRGTSYHPPQGPARINATRYGIALGLPREFWTVDERYTLLRVDLDSRILAEHDEAGTLHPVAWMAPSGAVAYIGLGHDADAYSTDTLGIVATLARLLLATGAPATVT